MNKPELQENYSELKETYSALLSDFNMINDNIRDKEASVDAYKQENLKVKTLLRDLKSELKDAKRKTAAQVNRANQLAHRKKELEYELTIYRKTIDTYGIKCDKLVGLSKVYFRLIEGSVPEINKLFKFFNPKSTKRFNLIKQTCEHAKHEISAYI